MRWGRRCASVRLMDEADKHLAEDGALFDFEEALELDDRERQAMADIAAGRFVSHEAVVRRVKSWGTENPSPRPECGE